MNQIPKRIIVYLLGTFLLGVGVTFSIKADLGVSPVSSLGYAIALITSISVGTAVFLANFIYIAIQYAISKKFEGKEYILQLISSLFIGVAIDGSLFLFTFLPVANSWGLKFVYLVVSLFIVSMGIFLYINARFPPGSYDALIPLVSERWHKPFGQAKTICDLTIISVSGILCLLCIQSLGSIGIGTIISAYFTGKILGKFVQYFKAPLYNWLGFNH